MNLILLAQGVDAVPASFIKNLMIVMLAALGGAGVVVGMYAVFRKKGIEPQPLGVEVEGGVQVEKRTQFVPKPTCKILHNEVDRRLAEHDKSIQSLWSTMREEDERTRAQLNKSFNDIERSLGRIEGKLDGR
jgi:hypothetical protein